jgi:non-specific serine/threonine protein kinase/serine/threonine-protein kinase
MSRQNGDDPGGGDPRTSEPTVDSGSLRAGMPRTIGRYALQGVIASGGMGTVYKAVQENPRRTVAVKVMRAGVTSASALRRFEYEAQLLGRLRHPGIAQIFEAGTHDDGTGPVPFFAMEYIPNARSITRFARDKKLGVREKLELFVRVCEAVHHGHQKGIVHRDLKPSNILVGPNGNPRVIDFGVARATDSDMALTMQQTDVGQLIGTVQYMSPEQCEADPHDLDTRSDVYALGVVLYQLLCDRLPYELQKTPIYEATRVIREHDPERPSAINAKLRGDIETIALKALEKERERRYQSAAELAQDLKRYLAGDAIAARPASLSYQLIVFARRNKGALIASAAIFVAILGGAILSTALYFRAENNRLAAEQQQDKTDAAVAYVQDLLASVDPTKYGDQVGVSELLEKYTEDIEKKFEGQPEIEAKVRTAIAGNIMYLNFLERTDASARHLETAERQLSLAIDLLRDSLGSDHPDTLGVLDMKIKLLDFQGRHDDLEQLQRELVETRTKTFGADHPMTLSASLSLGDELVERGRLDEAETLIARVLEVRRRDSGPGARDTLSAMSSMRDLLRAQGKIAEAERIALQTVEGRRITEEPRAKRLRHAVAALAGLYIEQGKIEQAEALYDGETFTLDELGLERWYLDGSPARSDEAAVVILVWWEPWCPFSQQFVPRFEGFHRSSVDKPVRVIGLTSLSRGTTEEQARDFMERNEFSFPNAKVDGRSFDKLGLLGVPAAAAILNGKLVWSGHPERVTSELIDALVRADSSGR